MANVWRRWSTEVERWRDKLKKGPETGKYRELSAREGEGWLVWLDFKLDPEEILNLHGKYLRRFTNTAKKMKRWAEERARKWEKTGNCLGEEERSSKKKYRTVNHDNFSLTFWESTEEAIESTSIIVLATSSIDDPSSRKAVTSMASSLQKIIILKGKKGLQDTRAHFEFLAIRSWSARIEIRVILKQ